MHYLIVFLGAGLGGVARYSSGLLLARFSAFTIFPVSTFTVNIVGSLLMGLIAGWFSMRHGMPEGWRLFLTTGVLGGFTTFSAFSLETVQLIENGNLAIAFIYIILSVLLGSGALLSGLYLMRLL